MFSDIPITNILIFSKNNNESIFLLTNAVGFYSVAYLFTMFINLTGIYF